MTDMRHNYADDVFASVGRRYFVAGLGASAISMAAHPLAAASLPNSGSIPYSVNGSGRKWYKGNTHMHTIRSDGDTFPIEAAALFKRDGYHFISFSDHNVSSAEPQKPIPVDSHKGKKISQEMRTNFERDFPSLELCRTVQDDKGRECYISASIEEIAKLLDEPGRFLTIGGNEVSAAPTAGKELHCNFINYPKPCRAKNERTVTECLDWIRDEYRRNVGDARTSIMTLNHPLWVSYDVQPHIIAERPDIRFFEVCNSGSMPRFNLPGMEFTHDKWWDVVNTMRAIKGQPLIYGLACDDIHGYTPMRKQTKRKAGYVQVLAKELTIPDIIEAFHRGDFYASTGLNLASVHFDRTTRTLSVEVDPSFGDDCRIEFIGSKKGVDTSVQEIVKWKIKGKPNKWLESRHFSMHRTVERYSDKIGSVFKTVKGRTASYTMQPDDLYVRAKVASPHNANTNNREPNFPIAWTQPISAKDML